MEVGEKTLDEVNEVLDYIGRNQVCWAIVERQFSKLRDLSIDKEDQFREIKMGYQIHEIEDLLKAYYEAAVKMGRTAWTLKMNLPNGE